MVESAIQEYERAIEFPIRRLRFPSLHDFRQSVLLQKYALVTYSERIDVAVF